MIHFPVRILYLIFLAPGGYTEWSKWIGCGGYKRRVRSCTNPYPHWNPIGSKVECEELDLGPAKETVLCNEDTCKSKHKLKRNS